MTRQIDSLAEIAPGYDAIVFDQYGVLHDGTAPTPWAPHDIRRLRETGVRLAVLTNSGKREQTNRARLADIGYPEDTFELVMSSGEALRRTVSRGQVTLGTTLAIEARPGDARTWAEGLALRSTDDPRQADSVLLMGLPEGSDGAAQRTLLDTARAAGLPLYCSNPDLAAPRPGGVLQVSPGQLAKEYSEAGGKVRLFGKPYPAIFDCVAQDLGVAPARLLLVGDSMAHDVLGAQNAGWGSVFVRSALSAPAFANQPDEAALASLAEAAGCRPPDFFLTVPE